MKFKALIGALFLGAVITTQAVPSLNVVFSQNPGTGSINLYMAPVDVPYDDIVGLLEYRLDGQLIDYGTPKIGTDLSWYQMPLGTPDTVLFTPGTHTPSLFYTLNTTEEVELFGEPFQVVGPSVPDAGSTLAMLPMGVACLIALHRRREKMGE